MNNRKITLLLAGLALGTLAFAQNETPAPAADSLHKNLKITIGLGLNYNQTTLTNPPAGYGQNQQGGSAQLNFFADYDKEKVFWLTFLNWRFGLLRIGSGPLEAGSSQKIPFQKTMDQLELSSMVGYRIRRDSTFALSSGFEIYTQATPSYVDPQGKVGGVFLKDIRNSGANPIQSAFFAPASVLAYGGIIYRPFPTKLFMVYAPVSYKGILVLNDVAARLVGKTDAQGLPTATVHGNPVEIVNGAPVFKKAFNQLGSYLMVRYNDRYFKDRFGCTSKLQLYSNYLRNPEAIDVNWQNTFDLKIIKGLSLSYQFDLIYDEDVLVMITDKNAPGGFTGTFGQRVTTQRQLMLRYQVTF